MREQNGLEPWSWGDEDLLSFTAPSSSDTDSSDPLEPGVSTFIDSSSLYQKYLRTFSFQAELFKVYKFVTSANSCSIVLS